MYYGEFVGTLEKNDVAFDMSSHEMCDGCPKRGVCCSCPPCVDSAEEMRAIIEEYSSAEVYAFDCAADGVEKLWSDSREFLLNKRAENPGSLAVACSGCTVCEVCSYPGKCRFPEKMLIPAEAYCIDVFASAKRLGVDMSPGGGVYRFLCFLFRP